MKILMVDDEPLFIKPYFEMLEQNGHKVVYCKEAIGALKVLTGPEQFDVIILDVMMPSFEDTDQNAETGFDTGIRLLEHLRDAESTKKTPVIILTNRLATDVSLRVAHLSPPITVLNKVSTPPAHLLFVVSTIALSGAALSQSTSPVTSSLPSLTSALPQTTHDRVIAILSKYHTPVPATAPIGSFVPDLDKLAQVINASFPIPPAKQFRAGELKSTWDSYYLSSVIDLKLN